MTNDIIEKLKYINLDLNNIPNFIKKNEKIKYRPKKLLDEKNYKVYKYLDINKIEILLTPQNRLTGISERYEKAVPIYDYLVEENIEEFAFFLKLLKQISIEEIKELEEQQKDLNINMPIEVKFKKDYLWQIYYSEEEDKYFMLAPIAETEYAELFYLLKKQLEKVDEKIFVPICYSEYSGKILTKDEIKNLENALWLFTKNWASIYEVYNKEGIMELSIIGKTKVFETVESDYKLVFSKREEAQEFYNLVQALFLLQMNFPKHYKCNIKIANNAKIEFELNDKVVNSENIVEYIKEEYKNHLESLIYIKELKINLENQLKNFKEISLKKQQIFLEKEKQISTFLECKKTFLGKVKYFFKYKKVKSLAKNEENSNEEEKSSKIDYGEKPQIKHVYTIQELMEITKKLEEENNNVKNLKLDIEGFERKIKTLDRKIENANLYMQEIDNHKKSIFEFLKFTSKDDANQLIEGMENKQNKKIKRYFNLSLDLKDIGEELDKLVRNVLTKQEQDATYLTTTSILQDINAVLADKEIPEKHLQDLKEQFKNNKTKLFLNVLTSEDEEFSVDFKGHRETKKNKLGILDIDESTTGEEYKEILKNIISKINTAKEKITFDVELPLYYSSTTGLPHEYVLFSIDPAEILDKMTEGQINIYKITIDENTHFIPLTNIIYFNNLNKTLPIGMNETNKVLINTRDLNLQLVKKQDNNILKFKDNKIHILELTIYEYKI